MTEGKLKILFFLPKMVGGGAERTILNIVNYIDRNRFRPSLLLHSATGPYLELLQEDVEVVNLGSSHKLPASIIPLARLIRSLRPALVFSTTWHANIVLAVSALISALSIPVIHRESNNLTAAGVQQWTLRNQALAWAYRRAVQVVTLSNGVKNDIITRYNLSPDKVATIYNPIDIANIEKLSREEPKNCPWKHGEQDNLFKIIAVGRLIKQKGFDILIEALSRLNRIPWKLCILGDGVERNFLLSLASKLKISDRVIFPGFVKNPYAWISCADLFVLSSRWEGFGHVIAEAMVCGTPVLATRCPSGPDEIINDNVDGLLCAPNSVKDMMLKIKWLFKNPDARHNYVQRAQKSVKRFDVKLIVKQYEELFTNLTIYQNSHPTLS